MAASNPSATTASQSPTPDIQQLVGLLGNLMPLLLRLQSQVFPQQVFPQQAFQEAFASQAFPSQAFEPSFQSGFGNFAIPNPALDRQAAENFIGDIITEQLRTLSAYLEANAGQYAGLQNSVPIVTQAAHRFAARDYAQAFNLIWLAYRAIEAARLADPKVPPPRAASVDQTLSSVH
ncbi:MAG: hypothetical protein E6G93_15375 [Alphaproteobacteria bacterium]|nr:MAG: hypothetical protein E6G93_15375 [Alphaproteobacteria bacterium]TMK52088.1 MAG: hypothetical protein E6G70_02320 [Alphaproteobacteria bacterium]